MELIYIFLISIIVYYLVTRLFENYSTQEDFDPSLVPVSSIVTLAKVAQKLVDGNGTLSNPANLTVTGNLVVNGDVTINGANLKLPINNFICDIIGKRRYLLNFNNESAYGRNAPSYENYYYTGSPDPTASSSVKPTFAHIFKTSDDKPGTINCGNITCGNITSNGTIFNNNIRITDRISMKNQVEKTEGDKKDIFAVINAGNDLEINTDSLTFRKGTNAQLFIGNIFINGNTGTIESSAFNASGKIDTQGGLSTNSNLEEAINCGGINTNSKNIKCGGNISCDSLTFNNILINSKSNWDYIFYSPHGYNSETKERFLKLTGGGWSIPGDPGSANNNAWVHWDSDNNKEHNKWTCPTTGLWTISFLIDAPLIRVNTWPFTEEPNFAIINETTHNVVSRNYGESTVIINKGDNLLVTGFWQSGGNVTIGNGNGHWKMKLILGFN